MRGKLKFFTTIAVSALVAALLSLMPATASADTTNLTAGQSINLATLIDNGLSVEIGDKVFGDFYFNYQDLGAPDVALASSNVNVRALSNDIGFGLEFLEPLIAVNDKNKLVTFEYTAMVDPDFSNLISDIHLAITGSRGGAGTGTVNEDVFNDSFGGTQVGHVANALGGVLSGTTNIVPPVVKLWVDKEVMVSGNNGGPGSFATITVIDQTYSQIPEPSTMLLVGLALLGAFALKRRT